MGSLAANVAGAQRPVLAKLMLDCEIPILLVGQRLRTLQSGRREWHGEHRVLLKIARKREHIQLLPPSIRIVKITVNEIDRETEWRLIVHVVVGVQFGRVVINTVAATEAGFAVAENVPSDAEARGHVAVLSWDNAERHRRSRRCLISRIQQARRRVDVYLRADTSQIGLLLKFDNAVIEVGEREIRFPPRSET